MNYGYLYFLLPAILFPLVAIINVSFGRKIGARKLSLYRQLTLTIFGLPIAFSLIHKHDIVFDNLLIIIFCGILGSLYLTIAFYAMNLTSIGISRSFVAVSRTICGFILGFLLFNESIGLYDFIGVCIIFGGFYILTKSSGEKLTKNDFLGIILSLLGGVLFTLNNLVFKNISAVFSPIESAYILEASSLIPLFILYAFTHKKADFIKMKHDSKKIGFLFLTAPLILIAGYGLAQSIHQIPFYIFNTLFVLVLITSMIFARIFLGEKISLQRGKALGTMMLGCVVIVLF